MTEPKTPLTHEELTPLEYKLYSRQLILPELGISRQKKLRTSHVAVLGAGGLGAPALLYLAAAGVGTLTVIDDDAVEISNLHRQIIHGFSDVGQPKADSAATTLRELNPLITVRVVKRRLTEQNAAEVFAGAQAVVDGSDNFSTRHIISAYCAGAGIAHIWGAILGFDAQFSVFWAGKGPVYEDLYPHDPELGAVPTCSTAGVVGALAGVVGTSMAMETLKVLTGIGSPLMGEVGYYSGLSGKWDYIPLAPSFDRQKSSPLSSVKSAEAVDGISGTIGAAGSTSVARELPDTKNPVDVAGVQQVAGLSWDGYRELRDGSGTVLLDVRERAEFTAVHIPGAYSLPLSELLELDGSDTLAEYLRKNFSGVESVVVYCSSTPRAEFAAKILVKNDIFKLYVLVGGLGAWLDGQAD